MKSLKIGLVTILFGVSTAFPAFSKPDISLVMETKKVTVKNEKEVISDVKAVQPGDILQYTIKVLNKGDSTAIDVEPIGNIPANTSYLPEQNKTKYQRLFSIDNGQSYQDTPKITIKENGKNVTKNAPTDMYKKIKWVIKKVNPKESYNINYRVKVK